MWVDITCFPEATAGVRILWISHSVHTYVCIFFDCVNDLNRPLFPFSSSLSFLPQSKSWVNTIEFYPHRLIFSKCWNTSLCIICSSLSFYIDISLKITDMSIHLSLCPSCKRGVPPAEMVTCNSGCDINWTSTMWQASNSGCNSALTPLHHTCLLAKVVSEQKQIC